MALADDIIENQPGFCCLPKETPVGFFSGVKICDSAKLKTFDIKEAFPRALALFEEPVSFNSILAKLR